jgi:processive 1,2-diacylglycerol beta-glucosyltransferase
VKGSGCQVVKKILFFPLLRMPSGHHQVADSVAGYLQKRDPGLICKKVDLLSAWNPIVENIVTKTYLEWISYFPKNYAWVYKRMAYNSATSRSYKYYEWLFMNKMKQIIDEEKPDLMICTHAFPSYFLSRLKSEQQCSVPVINIYTDFFINDVWGREGIDYHFVPSREVKRQLMEMHGVPEDRILVTGIPTDERIVKQDSPRSSRSKLQILISGGSVGLGNIADVLQQQGDKGDVEYFVLCGKNKKLYQKLVQLNHSNIYPLPYLSSREEMDDLYNKVDAIVTKPGGVTITEALKKGLPIFIHSALPGQEEINLGILKELNLIQSLQENAPIESQIKDYFQNKNLMEQFQTALKDYLTEIEAGRPSDIVNSILTLIDSRIEEGLKF